MRLTASLALALLLASPALARPLENGEAKKLQTAVNVYLGAIERGEAERVVGSLPPRVKNVFAGQAGIEAKKLDATLTAQTEQLLHAAQFSDLSADFAGLDAQDATLSDGTSVVWTVVPTHFTIATAKGKTVNDQPLLALFEGGKWYMMRIEGAAQQQLVAVAYPFLSGVTFPAASSHPAP